MTAQETIALADLRQHCAARIATASIPLVHSIAKQLGIDTALNHNAASDDAGKPWGME
jgi:hypothetical protein